MSFTATLMLSLGPFPGALAESDASLTIVSEVSDGILRITRFDVPDECQSGKQIARLTRNTSSKTTRIVGGAEVAIMISYNSAHRITDIRYEAGGLVSRSALHAAAAILKFDSMVGEQYELAIRIDKEELNYQLQKLQTASAEKHPVEFRNYVLAHEMQGSLAPRIMKWCVGNTPVPPSETQVPAKLRAYQTCIARGVPEQSCALNYLPE